MASPEVQARMLEIARISEMRPDAVYFGLSTLDNKSREVMEELIRAR